MLLPSVLWRCWLGGRKGIRPVKIDWWDAGMVICLWWDADLHIPSWCHCHSLSLAPVNPDWFYLPDFTFLVTADPGSPGHSPGGCKTVVVVVVDKTRIPHTCICACRLQNVVPSSYQFWTNYWQNKCCPLSWLFIVIYELDRADFNKKLQISLIKIFLKIGRHWTGFEPVWTEPNWLVIHHLNHSASLVCSSMNDYTVFC